MITVYQQSARVSRTPLHVGPGKLAECLGDLVTLLGSVLCVNKSQNQCRKGCVVVMVYIIMRLFYQVF